MTDAEIAIERLTAWVRDYGDSKPQAFIGDVSMLLAIAKNANETQRIRDALDWLVDEIHLGVRHANQLCEVSHSHETQIDSAAKLKAWSQAATMAAKAKERANKST